MRASNGFDFFPSSFVLYQCLVIEYKLKSLTRVGFRRLCIWGQVSTLEVRGPGLWVRPASMIRGGGLAVELGRRGSGTFGFGVQGLWRGLYLRAGD